MHLNQFRVVLSAPDGREAAVGHDAVRSSVPEDGPTTEAGRTRPVLSILRLSPETLRVAAGQRGAEGGPI